MNGPPQLFRSPKPGHNQVPQGFSLGFHSLKRVGL
jgi:NAD(P)-dependent dehydrogenase (short-subunit alcohol dehydrogenase family)